VVQIQDGLCRAEAGYAIDEYLHREPGKLWPFKAATSMAAALEPEQVWAPLPHASTMPSAVRVDAEVNTSNGGTADYAR
jgi:hypothetical protein